MSVRCSSNTCTRSRMPSTACRRVISMRSAELIRVPMAEVYEVATFYAHFDIVQDGEDRPAATTIRVCDSLSCMMAGAEKLLAALGSEDWDDVRVVRAPCIGACDVAPAVEVGHRQVDKATVAKIKKVIDARRTRAPDAEVSGLRGLQERGRLHCFKVVPRRQAQGRRRHRQAVGWRACAALVAPASRRAASGRSCAPKRARASWPSTATRASRAHSRIATISNAVRTSSWKAC